MVIQGMPFSWPTPRRDGGGPNRKNRGEESKGDKRKAKRGGGGGEGGGRRIRKTWLGLQKKEGRGWVRSIGAG